MTPYPHQRSAIDAVAACLADGDRCRVTMACGTGKTESAAWACAGFGVKEISSRVVVGLPSLNLVDQTWRRWAGMFQMPPTMAVCSDEKVGREVFRVSAYGLPRASTNVGEIASFLAAGGPCVVFCTYQSAERLAAAMDAPGVAPFDFAICDEAHRLTGKGSQGAAFLDNGRIRATRRTFWTATPRIVRGDDVISMDDPEQFGPLAFTYSFGEAIKDGRLSQFQVVAVEVSDPRVSDALASDKGVEDAAVVVAVAKAMRQYGLRRVISFHSLVERAAAFAEALPASCAGLPDEHRIEGVYANHVHAGTPMETRRSELARLRSSDGWTLLSNARCLGEGVDVPELDGIVFADPRTSEIEIWQAIGRAIRKSGDGKIATILIPVFIPKGMDAEEAIERGRFRSVFSVLKAMQAHDPEMSEVIVKWSERAKGGGASAGMDSEPLRFVFDGSAGMAAALSAVVVSKSSAKSPAFGFADRWPNSLTASDRHNIRAIQMRYTRGHVSLSYVAELEALPGWSWVYSTKDEKKSARMAAIKANWPDRLTPEQEKWIQGVRKTAQSKPDAARDAELEKLPGWSWPDRRPTDAWYVGFKKLQDEWPNVSPAGTRFALACRRQYAQTGYRRDPKKVALLESIAGWSWTSAYYPEWDETFSEVAKAWPAIDRKLSRWVANQKSAYSGRGTTRMTPDRIEKLESLPGWKWPKLSSGMPCAMCGADIAGRTSKAIYCSGKCSAKASNARYRSARKKDSDATQSACESDQPPPTVA